MHWISPLPARGAGARSLRTRFDLFWSRVEVLRVGDDRSLPDTAGCRGAAAAATGDAGAASAKHSSRSGPGAAARAPADLAGDQAQLQD